MITDDHLFVEKIKIYVAVSGGLDSMVLINLLLVLSNIELEEAHCNFTLRNKESNEDEVLIQKICAKKISCHVKKFDTLNFSKKISYPYKWPLENLDMIGFLNC